MKLEQVTKTLKILLEQPTVDASEIKEELSKLQRFIEHADRQIDQIERRVLKGEKIPHDEKVGSKFEEHTEWVSFGAAGVPVFLKSESLCFVRSNWFYLASSGDAKTNRRLRSCFHDKRNQRTFVTNKNL